MEQRSLFKVSYFRDRAYYEEFVVAENHEQVVDNYPLDVNWELIQQNIEVLYKL